MHARTCAGGLGDDLVTTANLEAPLRAQDAQEAFGSRAPIRWCMNASLLFAKRRRMSWSTLISKDPYAANPCS